MVSIESNVREVLGTIPDPEMPISIVDLGLVESVRVEDGVAHIDILPTFVGCPALDMIRDDIETKVRGLDGVRDVAVRFVYAPPWTVDRITEAGRTSLREHGVAVPEHGTAPSSVEIRTSAVPCPFCTSRSTHLDSPFGPTRCRMIYYCRACGNSFERMKRV